MNPGVAVTIVSMFLLTAPLALAQTERSGNADARVMQQLQQLTGERAALQSENARLKLELEQAKKEIQQASAAKVSLENRNKALAATAARGTSTSQQTEEQLERTRAQMQELIAKFRDTAQTLQEVETDRSTLKSQFAARERELKQCIDRNAGLYNLNTEVLDRMEDRGFWSSLAEKEPFLKLKRVELDNLIEDYKYRADELKLLEQQKQASTGR